MQTQMPIADTLASLAGLVHALDRLEPNHFTRQFDQAVSARELHEVILALGYAANSRELRDMGEERVHRLLNDIVPLTEAIRVFFRIDLWPASTAQLQSWTHALSRAASGKYAFRDNGAIRICLLDASLLGSTLSVKRIWTHVSDFSGCWTDFDLRLDAEQVAECRARLAGLRAFPLPL